MNFISVVSIHDLCAVGEYSEYSILQKFYKGVQISLIKHVSFFFFFFNILNVVTSYIFFGRIWDGPVITYSIIFWQQICFFYMYFLSISVEFLNNNGYFKCFFQDCPQSPSRWTNQMKNSNFPKSWWRTGVLWRCVWTAKSSFLKSSAQAAIVWCWPTREPDWRGRRSPSTCPQQARQSTAPQRGPSLRSEPCAFLCGVAFLWGHWAGCHCLLTVVNWLGFAWESGFCCVALFHRLNAVFMSIDNTWPESPVAHLH